MHWHGWNALRAVWNRVRLSTLIGKGETMAYFTLWQGLRGCYMPDSAYVIEAGTRRELKRALAWEAESIRDAGGVGMSKRAVAWLANAAWKARKAQGEYVAPYRWQYQDSYPYALGVFTGATRADYLAQEES